MDGNRKHGNIEDVRKELEQRKQNGSFPDKAYRPFSIKNKPPESFDISQTSIKESAASLTRFV